MVRRRRLASELRRLREAVGLTCDDVAGQLDCSASKISRIETGRQLVSPRDVRDLLGIYGVTGDQWDALIQLAREARQKGWWQGYEHSVEPHMATYLAMVSEASQIRHYSVTRIPTLLQAEDYARALVTGGRAWPAGTPVLPTGTSRCKWSGSGALRSACLRCGRSSMRPQCAGRWAAGRSCASKSSTSSG